MNFRSSHSEVFLGKGVLKICSKFTGEHPCRSVISINLLCNFNEITLRHGCSTVNLLHIFRTHFLMNTSGCLPLKFNNKIPKFPIVITKILTMVKKVVPYVLKSSFLCDSERFLI